MVGTGGNTSDSQTLMKMGQTNGFRLHGESNKAFQKITET
jgi:hypothetical protein